MIIFICSRNKGLLSSSSRILYGKQFGKCCSEPCDAANIASQEIMLYCVKSIANYLVFLGNSGPFHPRLVLRAKERTRTVEGSTSGDKNDDGLSSGSELSDDEGNADGAPNEMETDEEKKP